MQTLVQLNLGDAKLQAQDRKPSRRSVVQRITAHLLGVTWFSHAMRSASPYCVLREDLRYLSLEVLYQKMEAFLLVGFFLAMVIKDAGEKAREVMFTRAKSNGYWRGTGLLHN